MSAWRARLDRLMSKASVADPCQRASCCSEFETVKLARMDSRFRGPSSVYRLFFIPTTPFYITGELQFSLAEFFGGRLYSGVLFEELSEGSGFGGQEVVEDDENLRLSRSDGHIILEKTGTHYLALKMELRRFRPGCGHFAFGCLRRSLRRTAFTATRATGAATAAFAPRFLIRSGSAPRSLESVRRRPRATAFSVFCSNAFFRTGNEKEKKREPSSTRSYPPLYKHQL